MSKLVDLNNDNVTIINFYEEIKNHSDYLMIDGIHLTEEGQELLLEFAKTHMYK